MLVPVTGPNNDIGIKIKAPTTTPRRVAATACQKLNPNKIGNVPKIIVANVFAPPKVILNKSFGVLVLSFSEIVSIPCCSISMTFG